MERNKKIVIAQSSENATTKRVVAAHQPNFMPDLGYFYKMAQADTFVIVTNIQFERQERWQRQNKFKNNDGGDMWLTVPILGSQNQLIKDVKVKYEQDWCKEHRRSLWMNYGESPGRNLLLGFDEIYDLRYEKLSELNIAFIKLIKDALGITTQLVVDREISGKKHEFMANICKKYGGEVYLSGNGARSYVGGEKVGELIKGGIGHKFIGKSSVDSFKYSAVHHILMEGREEIAKLLEKPIEMIQR